MFLENTYCYCWLQLFTVRSLVKLHVVCDIHLITIGFDNSISIVVLFLVSLILEKILFHAYLVVSSEHIPSIQ